MSYRPGWSPPARDSVPVGRPAKWAIDHSRWSGICVVCGREPPFVARLAGWCKCPDCETTTCGSCQEAEGIQIEEAGIWTELDPVARRLEPGWRCQVCGKDSRERPIVDGGGTGGGGGGGDGGDGGGDGGGGDGGGGGGGDGGG